MLVLSRKKDETILLKLPGVQEPIAITVVRIDNNNRVRLGIQASKDVIVLRSELENTPNTSKNIRLEGTALPAL